MLFESSKTTLHTMLVIITQSILKINENEFKIRILEIFKLNTYFNGKNPWK